MRKMHCPQPIILQNVAKPPKHHQQGVALLTILLLVVAITIVAGSMLARQKIMLREYEVTKRQGQFRESALAGEAFARELIAQDSLTNKTDGLQDIWAKPLPEYPVDNGLVTMKIYDESDRFNLNNLYHDGKVDESAVNYFKALLQSQGLDPQIANAVLDWQDPDSDTTPEGGAEFDYYQSLGKPLSMPIANQPFLAVDELLLVKGMDKEKLAKLRPFITAVPYFLPINVNTVKPELLAVISIVEATKTDNQNNNNNNSGSNDKGNGTDPNTTKPPTDKTTAKNINPEMLTAITNWANTRQTTMPVETVDKLWQISAFNGISSEQQQAVASLLDVQSHGFCVAVTVKIDDKQSYFTSQLAKIDNTQKNQATQNTAQPNQQPQQVIAYNRQFLSAPIEP